MHRCKICGHEWDVLPSGVLSGYGCPKCYGHTLKRHEQYVEDIFATNPNIEVVGKYINSKTKILHRCKICNCEWLAKPNSILSLHSHCPECSKIHKMELLRKSPEQYVLELAIKNPNIEVVEQYIDAKTKILHRCKVCGHEWNPSPYNVLNNGSGCPICAGKVIGNPPEYKNSIWASEYREYFFKYMTEEQMKTYMPNSTQKIELPCPCCYRFKFITPSDLLNTGYGCSYCSDGVSYPNKFGRALIEQLSVNNMQNEYSPDWCIINGNKCRYDIYFEYDNHKYIVEMDGGLGHGNRIFGTKDKDNIGLERDIKKNNLAKEHDIQIIRIDCIKSEQEYIKNSVLESQLNTIFDLSNIDWAYCDRIASSNNIFEAAVLWNEGLSTKAISEKLYVHRQTVYRYLIKAKQLDLCDYSKEESHKRSCIETKQLSKNKKIIKEK
ncbi:MAG: zinc-ribbon domain-containing protein [Paludibacteraceae bacterium]|nr:zinc-ribbon domain-containing protein [Paludibacteraceae bacterium]